MTDTNILTPINFIERQGDLLQADVDVIAHQCNCISKGVSGLAQFIFQATPEANTYPKKNPDPRQFGTFEEFKTEDLPYRNVLNLYTQMYPGVATYGNDSDVARIRAFREALSQYLMAREGTLASIAFPKYIGCGLAGGNWDLYYYEILQLAQQYQTIDFYIIEKV